VRTPLRFQAFRVPGFQVGPVLDQDLLEHLREAPGAHQALTARSHSSRTWRARPLRFQVGPVHYAFRLGPSTTLSGWARPLRFQVGPVHYRFQAGPVLGQVPARPPRLKAGLQKGLREGPGRSTL